MRVHGYISGRVQGVFFRASTRDRARDLGLAGWVKNLDDGRVEFEAEGRRDDLENLVDWVREGPTQARVEDVELEWHDDEKGRDEFEVMR